MRFANIGKWSGEIVQTVFNYLILYEYSMKKAIGKDIQNKY